MNIKKPVDYSDMFLSLDMLMAKGLPQMELYRKIGGLVSNRPEKGAATAAAEYLQRTYPGTAGFSPRNLRRMREFSRAYADMPEILSEAMRIGWTQNVVILEAELTPQEQLWYIKTVQQCGWPKAELLRQIEAGAHLDLTLDLPDEVCYTEENAASETGASHAKAEDHQCNGAGIISIADGIPPSLFLLYLQLFHRRLHAQAFTACWTTLTICSSNLCGLRTAQWLARISLDSPWRRRWR